MRRRRLLWYLYPSYLFITLVALFGVAWLAADSIRQLYLDAVDENLATVAALLDEQISSEISADTLPLEKLEQLRDVTRAVAKTSETRITVIAPSGKVLADSAHDPATMENHADRVEFRAALLGSQGKATRYSDTLSDRMAYVALPIVRNGNVAGAVRASINTTVVDVAFRSIQLKVLAGAVAASVMVAALSLIVARRISKPLEAMRREAGRLARGEIAEKVALPKIEELASLAEALNQMASQLDERGKTIGRQGNEQAAILSSMTEGVLAIDSDERIISVNKAAAQVLGAELASFRGRKLDEMVRNSDLLRFAKEAVNTQDKVESDLVLTGSTERVLRVSGTSLRGPKGQGGGAVIVLNDITRFRHLENIRSDFVANVSHELKTPIASIKGFVETMLDGALNNPQDSRRFLEIVAKQADRLNAIIEDLLALARIEQSEEAADLVLEQGGVKDVLSAALYDCQVKAVERRVGVSLSCPDDLGAPINAPLLEQAVINLVENAIKYSEPGSEVQVSAEAVDGKVNISVADRGCGIESHHLPRLFERFYRVDKARSRKLGGTGLGLAIVKHIVQAHHGVISVESTPGQGSTFTIQIPRE